LGLPSSALPLLALLVLLSGCASSPPDDSGIPVDVRANGELIARVSLASSDIPDEQESVALVRAHLIQRAQEAFSPERELSLTSVWLPGDGAAVVAVHSRGASIDGEPHFFALFDVRTGVPIELDRAVLPSLRELDSPSEQVLRRLPGGRVLGRAWGDGLWFVLHGPGAGGPQLALLHWDGRGLDLRLLEGANPRLTDLDRDSSPELLYERRDGTRVLLQWDGARLVEWDVDGRTAQTESTRRLLREARRLPNP
jgi:hypothetical protein